ncbi:MAG: mannitol dehydrogenase family protein [Roseibium sp.]|uniref:mannitol dehydrogenase family protein n=1 Tax=Roseibium sp. TaxID=1936156 RepID=UPI003D9C4A89
MSDTSSPVQTIPYDRSALQPRILHLGFGAFAKAHVMVFHDHMLRQTSGDWGVIAARLHSGAEEMTQLDQAGGIFTVGEMSGEDIHLLEIGCISGTLHAKRDGLPALLSRIADPGLAVITLTITEKGYCLSGGTLDLGHEGIQDDLANPDTPRTAIAIIAKGLALRMAAGASGLTILSCDNLPANGHLCRRALLDYAAQLDPKLREWIEDECRFPCSMVDRITPAMTEASQQKLEAALGRPDPNGILCEPFRQWVIEDTFASERPQWDLAGAQFVADVAPFEEMKLRLLNGSHSFLAYLGALADKETIADCMNEPVLKAAAKKLMLDEQAPTLKVPEGVDIVRYADDLIARFSNPALRHKTTQIASDGSQKLPQRLLAPIRDHLRTGRPWALSAFAVAGWMHYCRGTSETGNTLPINDPLADQIRSIAGQSDGADYVDNLLSLKPVFGEELPASPAFADRIRSAYDAIGSRGVINSIAASL